LAKPPTRIEIIIDAGRIIFKGIKKMERARYTMQPLARDITSKDIGGNKMPQSLLILFINKHYPIQVLSFKKVRT
jgi:hypothetical protein